MSIPNNLRVTPLRIAGGLVIVGALGLCAVVGAAKAFGGIGGDASAALSVPITPELLQRGAYVAVAGDCAACHTAPGGQPLAGGLPIATPIGTVFTTNITPDKATGIGSYTYGAFERAVRRGIRPDGDALYPAMPFPSYAHTSDADTQALYAYIMHGVKPVSQPNKPEAISWPLSMRWPLTYWRWAFAPTVTTKTATLSSDPVINRGAYLVEGPEHCGTCHTDRGIGLQELALTPQQGPHYLSGGVVDNYLASDLRGDALTGLGSWSEADIVAFLKTGHNSHATAFGGMTDVVEDSTQHLSDSDLEAIARFLKSLPPAGTAIEGPQPKFVYEPAVAQASASTTSPARGASVYAANCAACHMPTGTGFSGMFPPLAGNPVVSSQNPISLIHIVLSGSTMPATHSAPMAAVMPGFASNLSDREVADVVTYIRSSWGNKGGPVDASQVTSLRAAIKAPQAKTAQ
jgi:alcohol dehydrogenase (quinone), cytochrome c subunit